MRHIAAATGIQTNTQAGTIMPIVIFQKLELKPNFREKSLADVIIFNIMSYIKRGDSDESIYNKRIKSNFKTTSKMA